MSMYAPIWPSYSQLCKDMAKLCQDMAKLCPFIPKYGHIFPDMTKICLVMLSYGQVLGMDKIGQAMPTFVLVGPGYAVLLVGRSYYAKL